MKNLDVKNKNMAIILAIAFAFIGMFSLGVNTDIVGKVKLYEFSASKIYILPLIIVIAILVFTKLYDYLFERQFTVGSMLSNGWYVLFAGIVLSLISYMGFTRERDPNTIDFFFFIISCFFTAIFEELLFRGIVQNILIKGFKKSKKSVWSAIIVSSVIFGIVHIGNLLVNNNLIIATISQIIYAFALGVILGTVYYKTKNILSTIILHAIFNILGSFSLIYILPKNENIDTSITAALIQIIIILPAIFIARKKYNKELSN